MSIDTKQLLAFSRMGACKRRRRESYLSYELGIRRETDAKSLRMGTAHHAATEALGNGKPLDYAVGLINELYERCHEHLDAMEWDYERETVVRIACGWAWRWAESKIEYVACEQSFELRLRNPDTGKETPIWNLAGKIDGIVKLPDRRLAVIEYKLLGDDISDDSDLWRYLRRDIQIRIYNIAARRLGWPVDAVLFDASRKPTIKPTAVPVLDALGAKIVLNPRGERVQTAKKCWRQTGDKELGYVVQERPMSSEEWGEKLNDDIAKRPEFYFNRHEIASLDDDLREVEREILEVQQSIREAQRSGRWFRTVSKQTCPWCAFDAICDRDISASSELPEGFQRVVNINPELGEINEHRGATSPTEETAAPASEVAAVAF